MPRLFEYEGIQFLYPENWKLEREDNEDGWTVSVQSADTAFLLLTIQSHADVDEVLGAALAALKADYPELEYDETIDSIAGLPAPGYDVRFISLDLTNTCWTRALEVESGVVLILVQFNDLETEIHERVLRAILASLKIAE